MLPGKWLSVLALGWALDTSSPQSLQYEVFLNDRAIGRMQVSSLATPEGIQHRVDADVRVNWFGERRMITHFTSTYQNEKLTEARFHDEMNGRTRHDAQVRWDGTAYRIRVNGKASQLTRPAIVYSTASLYAHEPEGIRELFSERFGRFCPIRPVAPHTYELTLPDGRRNRYRYRNGVCTEVEVPQTLFTVYFRLRDEP